MKNTIVSKISFIILVLLVDNAGAFGWSDLDPTYSKSAVSKVLKKVDPTNKKSDLRTGVKKLDVTDKNSAINKKIAELDPTDKNSALRKGLEWLTNFQCAKPFQAYVTGVFAACAIDDGHSGKGDIHKAEDLLIGNGFYSRGDFKDVTTYWCTPLKGINIAGKNFFGAAGMVAGKGTILLSRELKQYPAEALAATIGHEMVHVQQVRKKGFDKFACQYSGEMMSLKGTECGGNRPDPRDSEKGNFLECEAYKFGDKIEEKFGLTRK